MKINQWTKGLAAAGVVSLASVVQAEEAVHHVMTMVSSTTISGYVNTSAHWNPGSTPGVRSYIFGGGKGDGFNLDVVDLSISKPLDESPWAAGYKAELWFGPDANNLGFAFPNVNGLGTTSTGGALAGSGAGFAGSAAPATFQDFAIKQAYVALRVPVGNGIDFKMGVWDTIIGYETLNAGENPNYTRSWGNTIEPTQHTGILASYQFTDWLVATAGVANTWDQIINGRANFFPNGQSQKAYMGAVTLIAPESFGFLKGGSLTAGVVDGRTTGSAGPDLTSYYVGASIPTPVEGLAVGAAFDLLETSGGQNVDAWAAAGYVSYQATEKLKINARGEYFDPGAAIGPALFAPLIGGTVGGASGGTEVLTATLTVDYALWQNVITRAEYRWDHDLSGRNSFAGGTPVGGGLTSGRNNAHLLALNVIYNF